MSDVDDAHAASSRDAAETDVTIGDLLRREATDLASRPSIEDWLARTRGRPSAISRADVLEALDEVRGEWPGPDR